jgi:RNA polymerase sigma-70 factor (ECF subfamily)
MSVAGDQGAVDRVLAGDVSVFEELVRRWQGPLVNLAYRFCHDRGRAEDMAQEAFLRAFRALRGWRRDSAFSTWLFALAVNLYRSELRRLPTAPMTLALDEIAEPRASGSTVARLEDEDRDRVVRRAVLALPAKYREAVIVFYFHEMDTTAAAESLGLPVGTLKTRLARARELLRRKLTPLSGEPRLEEALR